MTIKIIAGSVAPVYNRQRKSYLRIQYISVEEERVCMDIGHGSTSY